MRVRITKSLSGSIDGIQLGRFTTGLTYDVGTTLGNYLLAEGCAVPAESQTPALVVPIHYLTDVVVPGHQIAEAADRPPRRNRPRVRKKR
jgi:hypothetical protein